MYTKYVSSVVSPPMRTIQNQFVSHNRQHGGLNITESAKLSGLNDDFSDEYKI